MALGKEMLEFTRSFFRGCPDLSTVTHSIVRQKFLTQVGRDHLEPEEKQALKRLVEEELLKMQANAGTREGKLEFIKVKRSAPCSGPESKRFRFNSESESSSAPSSPDCSGSPTKSATTKKTRPRRALKKCTNEDQQTDLAAKMGAEESSEEGGESPVRSGEEGGESPVRSGEAWKEDDGGKGQKRRARKQAGAENKQVPRRASAGKQTREESERREDEGAQIRARAEGSTHANARVQSEDSEEEILAKKSKHREPRARGHKRERARHKQKSKTARLTGGLGDSEEEKETGEVSSGDSSGEEENTAKRESKDRPQTEGGRRRTTSSEEDENSAQAQATPQGSVNGESDVEGKTSDSQAGDSTDEERRNRSSKKGKARSSSSSSDASPQPTGQKAGSRRRGEDHPAVVRLKRYIRACGAHRNYKKLLGSCRSHKDCLSVLRAELEALGMKGNPSLEKCRALKEQREEAAELASLDVANIISSSSGRPRRRNAWNPSGKGTPPGELYHRTLDSEEEGPRQAPPDWSHMRGIISSDGESS